MAISPGRNGNDESDDFGIGLFAVLAAVVGLSLALFPNTGGMQAQGGSPATPANVRAANVDTPGQVVVRWDAVADAAYYRIGWVNMETFQAVQAEGGREWLDVFAFHDVVNRGQTNQTLSNSEPGVQYAFIADSVGHRFGNVAGWSDWAYLTTAAAPSCPTGAGTTPDEPGGGSSTPTSAPVGRDYDTDDDGLIEIASLAQLDVIRHGLDGDGVSAHADHAAMFPDAARGMGCLYRECVGYELDADLDFDTNGNGSADAGDAYWSEVVLWLQPAPAATLSSVPYPARGGVSRAAGAPPLRTPATPARIAPAPNAAHSRRRRGCGPAGSWASGRPAPAPGRGCRPR